MYVNIGIWIWIRSTLSAFHPSQMQITLRTCMLINSRRELGETFPKCGPHMTDVQQSNKNTENIIINNNNNISNIEETTNDSIGHTESHIND